MTSTTTKMPSGWMGGPSAMAYGIMQSVLRRPGTLTFDHRNAIHVALLQQGWVIVQAKDRPNHVGAIQGNGYMMPAAKLRDAREELFRD